MKTLRVEALDPRTGQRMDCGLEIGGQTTPPYSLRLQLPGGGCFIATHRDYFECLRAIRRELDEQHILLLCNGARRDAWASGLLRSSGGATKVSIYPLEPSLVDAVTSSVVGIFEPAEPSTVSTVIQQTEYADSWHLRHLGCGLSEGLKTGRVE